jgi:MFS family permease
MMGLIYAVQGSFWPLLAVHLDSLQIAGRDRGWIFATFALGSFVMPLGAGQLVDRLMATQRLLALIYALGSGFLIAIAMGAVTSTGGLFVLFLGYWLLTAPAYGLGTSLALRHLAHPEREFGQVRLWGTFGWMAAGWIVSIVFVTLGSVGGGEGAYEAFWVAAVLSLLLAGYALTLPDTPPLAVGPLARSGPREAIDLLRRPGIGVFLVTALGVSITTPFVYQVLPTYLGALGLERRWISTTMTLGQWPEIAGLAVMPWLLRRTGYRATLALGIGAWVVRYGTLLANPPLWVAIAGIPLHGVGIACFTVCGQMFMDSRASVHRRASAQALLVVLTSGAGCLLGSLLGGEMVHSFGADWRMVFLVPCVINVALLTYFCAGFRSESTVVEWLVARDAARSLRNDVVRGAVAHVGNLLTESADG